MTTPANKRTPDHPPADASAYDRLVDRLGYLVAKYWLRHRDEFRRGGSASAKCRTRRGRRGMPEPTSPAKAVGET